MLAWVAEGFFDSAPVVARRSRSKFFVLKRSFFRDATAGHWFDTTFRSSLGADRWVGYASRGIDERIDARTDQVALAAFPVVLPFERAPSKAETGGATLLVLPIVRATRLSNSRNQEMAGSRS